MPAAPGRLGYEALRPGARLGRYELLVPVAAGGMARVWAARQHGTRGFTKLVALKTILPHLARDPEFERMFLDEARISSGVHHPNVCEIYELGEEGSVLYLAMEWISGDALSRVLRGDAPPELSGVPIEPRVAARVLSDAAAGVHAAHNATDEMGAPLCVVHRDVSPHNVLFTADGITKVTDFGVAKALGQVHSSTQSNQLRGKLAYMPPEQVGGTHVDRRTDVFALGCVLYEATTGRPAFAAESEARLLQVVARGEFARPRELVPGYPEELEAVVLRAMARDPLQRFGSAERLRFALEEWLARSGPIVTPSQVAAVVQQRVGPEIERRRARIRDASGGGGASSEKRPPRSAQSSSGVQRAPSIPDAFSLGAYARAPAGDAPPPSAPPPSAPPPSAPPPTSVSASGVVSAPAAAPAPAGAALRYVLAIGVGVAVALAIGVAAVLALSAR